MPEQPHSEEKQRRGWHLLGIPPPKAHRSSYNRVNALIVVWFLMYSDLGIVVHRGWLPLWGYVAALACISLVVTVAYIRYLNRSDELLRRITLEACSISWAVSFFYLTLAPPLERMWPPSVKSPSMLFVLHASFLVANVILQRRYT